MRHPVPSTSGHRFHNPPAATQPASGSPHYRQAYQDFPTGPGQAPYRLSLDTVIGAANVKAIQDTGQIVFHIVGDTGGVQYAVPQTIVAMKMEEQFKRGPQDDNFHPDDPAFFYHLGDIVYFNGEHKQYYPQFYDPYQHYPAPILGIPGNHDGDPLPPETSLEAFRANLCDTAPHHSPDAQDAQRTTMTQPNVYFTLEAPFVTIVGLYTNVPEHGVVQQDQVDWFTGELRDAPKDKALIVAMHHPIYSLDDHHGSSANMGVLLDAAIQQSGRVPDIVFAAHVHNYQRFTRPFNGRQIPYLVVGSGGYHNLHYVGKQPDGTPIQTPTQVQEFGITFEKYHDNDHGFMRLTISPDRLRGDYYTAPRPQDSWRKPASQIDAFSLDWKQGKLDTPTLTLNPATGLQEPANSGSLPAP